MSGCSIKNKFENKGIHLALHSTLRHQDLREQCDSQQIRVLRYRLAHNQSSSLCYLSHSRLSRLIIQKKHPTVTHT